MSTKRTKNPIWEDRGFSSRCLIWQGAKTEKGYGLQYFRRKGKTLKRRVHRVQYEKKFGTIPLNHDLHHLCKQKDCINTNHLQPVLHDGHYKFE